MRIVCSPDCPRAEIHGEGVIASPNPSRCTCGAVGFKAKASEAVDVIRKALEWMDRAGGDGYGMPQCPWCTFGPDGTEHAADCELEAARRAVELLSLLRVEPNCQK